MVIIEAASYSYAFVLIKKNVSEKDSDWLSLDQGPSQAQSALAGMQDCVVRCDH